MKPRIYNRDMQLAGVLQNASRIGYSRKYNDLHTASFELPAADPKNELCDTHCIVDIFDGDRSKGKFRLLDEPESDITSAGAFVQYSLEHVIAFLLNDFIDGYFETGGTGVNTATVISQLLAMQNVKRWKLGECDFNFQFQYSWENANVLEALFSIPTCFDAKYHWVYDTSTYPWTISLKAQSTERSCEIRRKRNMQCIKRGKDSSALCTRLYCKGSGEGVNQLGISEVNPTGKPYIDADTIESPYNYGILCAPFIDKSITDASLLYARGLAVLEEVKYPRYTYTAKAVDLSKLTGLSWDEYDEGKCVHLIDDEKNLDIDAVIIETAKPDVDGHPLDMDVVISNKSSDVASSIEELAHKTAITAQYSQGATNLYSQQYADNADKNHPAIMRVYVPNGCARINQMLLSWSSKAFRAYETGAEAGGATATTTENDGGSTSTSSAAGDEQVTSEAGGSSVVAAVDTGTYLSGAATIGATALNSAQTTSTDIQENQFHVHTVYGHTHTMANSGLHYHTINHTHNVTIPAHSHTVNVPAHTHSVNIPSHTHKVTLLDHTHGILFGIFEGSTASSVDVYVDNTMIPAESLSANEMDIIAYLVKDNAGKITRGTWHTIKLVPDSLTRIEANLFVQTFVTSYSGGNY